MTLHHFHHYLYRISSALIGASLVTLGLLLFMHQLIKMDAAPIDSTQTRIDFDAFEPPQEIEPIVNTKPEQPVEPIEQPKIEFETSNLEGPDNDLSILTPSITNVIDIDLTGGANGNAVSMMQVAPNYPERARRKGIEGYVDLIFDLTATGQTKNIRILNAVPQGYFENASMRALKKWKYQPAVEDGKAVAMYDMTTRISYTLDE